MRTRARLLLLAALLGLPALTSAQPARIGTEPYTLEGIVAENQTAAREAGWFAVSVGVIGDSQAPVRWIGVTAFRTWNDNSFAGRQDLRRLLLADPTFLFTGPRPLLEQWTGAPVGGRLVIRGMLNKASRNFLLSAVTVPPASGTEGP